MSLATLRLFKALPIDGHSAKRRISVAPDVHRHTIPKGFVFSPEIVAAYPHLDSIINDVDGAFGVDPEALNKSFHKSFAKVRDASLRQLYYEQMAHYVSTYGAERLGIYDSDRIFVPAEALNVPAIDVDRFSLVVIGGLTTDELKDALLDLLSTGVALSEQSVKDCLDVASMVSLTLDEVESVKNREVAAGLYELYGLVPGNPVEFLRYVVYRTTGETLLIKNRRAVETLKAGVTTHNAVPLFNIYEREHSLERLGEIFLRYKPLFLAMRADNSLRPVINKIRRAAERNHKPMPVDYLNSVTALIKATTAQPVVGKNVYLSRFEQGFDFQRLQDELANPKVNVFRKARLAQALRLRTNPDLDSIVYKVRNGKSYATDFAPSWSRVRDAYYSAYTIVLRNIADSLGQSLAGRRVYIPEGVVYGLPSTEKQFTGNYPAGSYVQVRPGQALVAGVYWEDQGGTRIDLDLSIANAGGKIGWDAQYRTGDREVVFSGDNTAAPNGASEVFWIGPSADGSWLMSVNFYNSYDLRQGSVPYKLVVGTADKGAINSNFVFDANRLVASATAEISAEDRQHNLGLIVADPSGGHRFYLGQANVGGGATARYGINAERTRKFMQASLQSAPTLNDVLYYSGAVLVDSPEQADEGLDLSPAAIDKTTILSLLTGKAAV